MCVSTSRRMLWECQHGICKKEEEEGEEKEEEEVDLVNTMYGY